MASVSPRKRPHRPCYRSLLKILTVKVSIKNTCQERGRGCQQGALAAASSKQVRDCSEEPLVCARENAPLILCPYLRLHRLIVHSNPVFHQLHNPTHHLSRRKHRLDCWCRAVNIITFDCPVLTHRVSRGAAVSVPSGALRLHAVLQKTQGPCLSLWKRIVGCSHGRK